MTPAEQGRGFLLSARLSNVCLLSEPFFFFGFVYSMDVCLILFSIPVSPLQACAHRWKNVYYNSEHILPHGYCSIIPPTLQGRTKPLIPCYEGKVEAPQWTQHSTCWSVPNFCPGPDVFWSLLKKRIFV